MGTNARQLHRAVILLLYSRIVQTVQSIGYMCQLKALSIRHDRSITLLLLVRAYQPGPQVHRVLVLSSRLCAF